MPLGTHNPVITTEIASVAHELLEHTTRDRALYRTGFRMTRPLALRTQQIYVLKYPIAVSPDK